MSSLGHSVAKLFRNAFKGLFDRQDSSNSQAVPSPTVASEQPCNRSTVSDGRPSKRRRVTSLKETKTSGAQVMHGASTDCHGERLSIQNLDTGASTCHPERQTKTGAGQGSTKNPQPESGLPRAHPAAKDSTTPIKDPAPENGQTNALLGERDGNETSTSSYESDFSETSSESDGYQQRKEEQREWLRLLSGFMTCFDELSTDAQMCLVARLEQVGAVSDAARFWARIEKKNQETESKTLNPRHKGDPPKTTRFFSGLEAEDDGTGFAGTSPEPRRRYSLEGKLTSSMDVTTRGISTGITRYDGSESEDDHGASHCDSQLSGFGINESSPADVHSEHTESGGSSIAGNSTSSSSRQS